MPTPSTSDGYLKASVFDTDDVLKKGGIVFDMDRLREPLCIWYAVLFMLLALANMANDAINEQPGYCTCSCIPRGFHIFLPGSFVQGQDIYHYLLLTTHPAATISTAFLLSPSSPLRCVLGLF